MATTYIHVSDAQRAAALATAADALEAGLSANIRALVGFDGFIDVLLKTVGTRKSMLREDYDAIATIPAFAERINLAAGKSAGIEFVSIDSRFGGNGPLLAGGLANLGAKTKFIGCVAADNDGARIHPMFADFAKRCEQVVPLAPPALTHALEFSDGKIMFNMPDSIQHVTWETLVRAVGQSTLLSMFEQASLIAVVNWSIMAGVESILEGMLADMLPALAHAAGSREQAVKGSRHRRLFVDLSDPSKRTPTDLARVLRLLSRMNEFLPVTLGMNLNEAELAHAALHHDNPPTITNLPHAHEKFASRDKAVVPAHTLRLAHSLREILQLETVVVHPREGAAAAHSTQTAWMTGPFTPNPALSTGAGDHFGAGFALAQAMHLPIDACLAMAVACSGAYVRDAASPSATRLASFLRAGW